MCPGKRRGNPGEDPQNNGGWHTSPGGAPSIKADASSMVEDMLATEMNSAEEVRGVELWCRRRGAPGGERSTRGVV